MKEIIVSVDVDGRTSGLHFDEFDLGFLGDKKVERASEIFFNESTQSWDVLLPGETSPRTSSVTCFTSYDTARTFEVLWLQECMKAGCKPSSAIGVGIAMVERTKFDSK